MPDFLYRLKAALTGSAATPLVFLGNFEVEAQWAIGEPGLPRISFAPGNAVVNRMDELALLLAGQDDYVVLKSPPDAGHLAYLAELGLELPHILVARPAGDDTNVTEDALADPDLARSLSLVAATGARLAPHGVSEREELLAARAGLALATPPAAVCKQVNSKIYSRLLADEVGLRQPLGWPCPSMTELATALPGVRTLLERGRPVVVKDAYGVSGKGMTVVRDARRLEALYRKLRDRADRSGDDRAGLVIEEWVAKRADLNYQFTLTRDGDLTFDFVKEALTEAGVHKGHRLPARLLPGQVAQLREAAQLIGKRLAADGYYGVVGVDAMVGADEQLLPLTEINARYNMSTYQLRLEETFMTEESVALTRHYPIRGPVSFAQVKEALGPVLFDQPSRSGLLVEGMATANTVSTGRLYAMVFAQTVEALARCDEEAAARLAELGGQA